MKKLLPKKILKHKRKEDRTEFWLEKKERNYPCINDPYSVFMTVDYGRQNVSWTNISTK